MNPIVLIPTPVVLIATHQRQGITSKNIDSLLKQSLVPQIVLGVSDPNEAVYYKREYPMLEVYCCNNAPLGNKWQTGVMIARKFLPNPLIINGSDDILGRNFVEKACELLNGDEYDFIGLNQWYVLHKKTFYHLKYNASIPLGGGRCYSRRLLKAINFQVFDVARDSGLDDFGYKASQKYKTLITGDLPIVSIKGDWVMLNDFQRFHNHRNCTILSRTKDISILNDLIDYEDD